MHSALTMCFSSCLTTVTLFPAKQYVGMDDLRYMADGEGHPGPSGECLPGLGQRREEVCHPLRQCVLADILDAVEQVLIHLILQDEQAPRPQQQGEQVPAFLSLGPLYLSVEKQEEMREQLKTKEKYTSKRSLSNIISC
ncbi:hypothetical protein AALO_G00026110, partial [Alosa alosa]